MNNRRLMRLAVTPEFIALLTSGSYRVVAQATPEDARIVGAHYNGMTDTFEVILESKKFAETLAGAVLPLMTGPMIERIDQRTG